MIQKFIKITFDRKKRDRAFEERGLAFEDVVRVFAGTTFTLSDDRYDYGEIRYLTLGTLNGREVVVVWTERGDAAHVFR